MTYTKTAITHELAARMVGAAITRAKELGVRQNVVVLDEGGNLKAFGRMDGAPILGIGGCQRQAYTALYGMSTEALYPAHQGRPVPADRPFALFAGDRRGRRFADPALPPPTPMPPTIYPFTRFERVWLAARKICDIATVIGSGAHDRTTDHDRKRWGLRLETLPPLRFKWPP